MNLLEDVLSSSDFAETVSRTAYGASTAATMTARIDRQSSTLTQIDNCLDTETTAQLKVLSTVHATYGGVVSPSVGDVWGVADYQGGATSTGWIAGVPVGRSGWWEIPVTKRTRIELGHTRKGGEK